jgi:hypothetical protein
MKKNKCNMILIFLGCLIVLLFMLFFSNKEGMEGNCTYQYLSPNQTNTPLDENSINRFITMYNANMLHLGSNDKLTRTTYDKWVSIKVWCTEEIQYYIKNNYFPINSYLLYELKNNNKIKLPSPFTKSTIAFGYSARILYYQLVVPSYSGNPNLPSNTKEAQSIYSGITPEPACDSTASTDSTDSTPSTTPTPTTPTPTASTLSATSMGSATNKNMDACNAACNDACNNDASYFK